MFLKKRRSKRADITLTTIINLAIAGFVFFLIMNTSSAYASGEADAKVRHAKEIALMIEAASAAEGNFYLRYPNDLKDFNVKITNKEVIVYKNSIAEPTRAEILFINSFQQYLNYEFFNPRHLVIYKIGNKIYFGEEFPNINQYECPEAETRNIGWPREKILVEISENLEGFYSLLEDTYSVEKEFERERNYLFISQINLYEEFDRDFSFIKIYYDVGGKQRNSSEKLGCTIINEFSKEFEIDAAVIVPINTLALDSLDPKFGFFNDYKDEDRPGVYVVLNFGEEEPGRIKKAFEKALLRYFT